MSDTLIVYFSRTGHTRKVAEEIARQTGCDTEEIHELRSRRGLFGYFRSGKEALREEVVEIGQTSRDPFRYDLVIVGTPVWAGNMSSPVRSYVARNQGRFRDVAFFCTQGGSGSDKVFARLGALTGKSPLATLVVLQREARSNALGGKVAGFVESLRLARLEGASRKRPALRAVPD